MSKFQSSQSERNLSSQEREPIQITQQSQIAVLQQSGREYSKKIDEAIKQLRSLESEIKDLEARLEDERNRVIKEKRSDRTDVKHQVDSRAIGEKSIRNDFRGNMNDPSSLQNKIKSVQMRIANKNTELNKVVARNKHLKTQIDLSRKQKEIEQKVYSHLKQELNLERETFEVSEREREKNQYQIIELNENTKNARLQAKNEQKRFERQFNNVFQVLDQENMQKRIKDRLDDFDDDEGFDSPNAKFSRGKSHMQSQFSADGKYRHNNRNEIVDKKAENFQQYWSKSEFSPDPKAEPIKQNDPFDHRDNFQYNNSVNQPQEHLQNKRDVTGSGLHHNHHFNLTKQHSSQDVGANEQTLDYFQKQVEQYDGIEKQLKQKVNEYLQQRDQDEQKQESSSGPVPEEFKKSRRTKVETIDEIKEEFENLENENEKLFQFIQTLSQEHEFLQDRQKHIDEQINHYERLSTEEGLMPQKQQINAIQEKIQFNMNQSNELHKQLESLEKDISNLKISIPVMFDRIGCNTKQYTRELGEDLKQLQDIDESSMLQFLAIIEKRTNDILQLYHEAFSNKTKQDGNQRRKNNGGQQNFPDYEPNPPLENIERYNLVNPNSQELIQRLIQEVEGDKDKNDQKQRKEDLKQKHELAKEVEGTYETFYQEITNTANAAQQGKK